MTDKLAIGLAGVGSISQVAHLPALNKNPRVKITGFCDAILGKAQALAKTCGVSVATSDIGEMVERGGCDAVIISAPTRFHLPLAREAMENGSHVLLEMPPVLNLEEALELKAISKSTGKTVALIRHKRHGADSQRLRTILDGDELGVLQYIRISYNFERGFFHGSWRGQVSLSGGGVFMDQGIQLLDLGLFIADAEGVRAVSSAAICPIVGPKEIEEVAAILLRLNNGVVLSMFLGPWLGTGDPGLRLQAYGSGGTASLPGLEIHKEFDGSPVTVVPRLPIPRRDIFQQSYKDSLDLLTGSLIDETESLAAEPNEIVKLMKVTEEVYSSTTDETEHVLR